MAKPVDPNCRAFQRGIEVLSRPWNGLILGLLLERPLRFGELEEAARGLGPKTLAARLKALEAGAIIARRVEAGPPVRVEYSLTPKGRAFGRVMEAIQQWGGEMIADESAPVAARQAGDHASGNGLPDSRPRERKRARLSGRMPSRRTG